MSWSHSSINNCCSIRCSLPYIFPCVSRYHSATADQKLVNHIISHRITSFLRSCNGPLKWGLTYPVPTRRRCSWRPGNEGSTTIRGFGAPGICPACPSFRRSTQPCSVSIPRVKLRDTSLSAHLRRGSLWVHAFLCHSRNRFRFEESLIYTKELAFQGFNALRSRVWSAH